MTVRSLKEVNQQAKHLLSQEDQNSIENTFTYHAPIGDQVKRYAVLRDAAKDFAYVLYQLCPPSADRSAAIRKLRECVMTANASIAINEAPNG